MSTADTRTTVAAAYEDETVVLGYLQHRKRFAWQRLLHNSQSARLNYWRRKCAAQRVLEVAPGSFEALRECRLGEGSSPQQLKVSRVLRSPAHEELLLARVLNLDPRR